MPSLEGDDRRVGSQGYMFLSERSDGGADDLLFMTPPPGRNGVFRGQPAQDTFVPIRAWATMARRGTCDVTSSAHYSPDYDMTFAASLPASAAMEIRIEGVMRLSFIPQTIMAALYDGAAFSHVLLGIDDETPFFEGDCLVTGFTASSPIDGAVTYSAVLRPFGVYTGIMIQEF